MTIEGEIFDAVKTQLETLPWVKTVEWEKIKVDVAQFQRHEIPAIQFFWNGTSTQQQQRGLTTTIATMAIEVILKDSSAGEVNQKDLFEKRSDVKDSMSEIVGLPQVNGFKHFMYSGREYDIHMVEGFHIARLDFQANFTEPYGYC